MLVLLTLPDSRGMFGQATPRTPRDVSKALDDLLIERVCARSSYWFKTG
jgi:hypothetical protein